ncbi:MAG: hypothetical protein ACLURP_14810 [Ruminococcus sp.]
MILEIMKICSIANWMWKALHFIAFDTPPAEFRAKAKVRYRQEEQWATVRSCAENIVYTSFLNEPQKLSPRARAAVCFMMEA